MDAPVILAFASAFLAAAMGCVVVWHKHPSVARWAFCAGMAVLAVESILAGLSAGAVLPDEMVYWQDWRLLAKACLPTPWLLFSLAYARGNYREFLTQWRVPLALAFVVPIGLALAFHASLIVSAQRSGPGDAWILGLGLPGFVISLLFLVSAILVLMNLERTFRAAVGTMRWRLKFMILGLGVLFAVRAYSTSQALVFRAVNLPLQTINFIALLVACGLILRSLSRPGHFEVSVYPSHSVLRNSFTLMVAGIYLLIVGVFAKVVAFLGGDASFTLKAFLVLVLLVLATMVLLSDRARLHTKRFVSRYFQRPLYDYRTVWRTFTEGTARCVEQAGLCDVIVKLTSEIFQALAVTMWLVDDKKQQLLFITSTSLSETKAGHLALDAADAAQVIAALSSHPEPVDLDSSKQIWASALRRLHPDEFHKGGNRICAPLVAGGDLLGLMIVGDRVGGVPFSVQDLDLLKSVGDQSAASLLNIQLSQRLSQARQLEAFQAMSAFFVHDLKNTASTLSLMLQNLPAHFHDPQFREDALRGISKTVTHINDLIKRLGLLRQELTIKPVDADLNEVVTLALRNLGETVAPAESGSLSSSIATKSDDGGSGGEGRGLSRHSVPATAEEAAISSSGQPGGRGQILTDLRPLPKVSLDPAQIQTVITNLVLNAKEAAGPGGRITVETSQRNGWVVLSVADNGCGMTPEFVQRSLFRPFQTTKKTGIGIGMFQCKIIVEAHRGRIEVDTEPGKGASFRVLLPIAPIQSSSSSSS